MVLERYRGWASRYLERLSEPYLSWNPNHLSALAFGLVGAAAVLTGLVRSTTPLLFFPAAVLVFLGGLYDVLDGEVARRTHRASARGDFLDHVLDRYADVVLLLGIAVCGYASPILALLALVTLLLVSYMGTQAQAVGIGREYRGLLSRADRLILITAALLLEFLFVIPWPWAPSTPWARFTVGGFTFTIIDVVLVYFVIAGQITAATRARSTFRALPPPTE